MSKTKMPSRASRRAAPPCSASRLTPDVEPTIAESEIVQEGQALRDLDAEKKEDRQ